VEVLEETLQSVLALIASKMEVAVPEEVLRQVNLIDLLVTLKVRLEESNSTRVHNQIVIAFLVIAKNMPLPSSVYVLRMILCSVSTALRVSHHDLEKGIDVLEALLPCFKALLTPTKGHITCMRVHRIVEEYLAYLVLLSTTLSHLVKYISQVSVNSLDPFVSASHGGLDTDTTTFSVGFVESSLHRLHCILTTLLKLINGCDDQIFAVVHIPARVYASLGHDFQLALDSFILSKSNPDFQLQLINLSEVCPS
jgi:hypothetical protein